MDTIRTVRNAPTPLLKRPAPRGASPGSHASDLAHELAFVKLDCSVCRGKLILDVEEHWNRELEDAETVGRRFLGLSQDAVLCPRCLHEVETAGAERIYWSLACS